MDVPRSNESDYELDYSDYYELDALSDFLLCEKHQVRKFSRYFLPGFYSVACALGLLANLTLLLALVRSTPARRAHPACVLCADLLFTCTLPFWAVYAARDWVFGAGACRLVTLVYALGLYSSNLFVALAVVRSCLDAACVFRCLGRVQKTRKTVAWCTCVWMLSCLAAAPHLNFVAERHVHDETHCTYQYSHGWKVFMRLQQLVLVFWIPFLLLLASCVVSFLRSRSDMLRRALISTALFFTLWFPYTLVLTLHVVQDLHLVWKCSASLHLDLAIQSTECIAFAHVFINPVSHLLLNLQECRALRAVCGGQTVDLLEDSEDLDSGQDGGLELTTLQSFSNPEYESESAEKHEPRVT
ncbi:C-C chemokine receptor type 4 [Bagarius yarrelli]|uniref:C-C chemokine receptor type 4 n=1 Tax=Bagarius yarrelli TaxID=175774 RepID=A0A556VWP0_BAGYA|nr:C-C chemokine receptor type 4 [Bagarius yarrelli]